MIGSRVIHQSLGAGAVELYQPLSAALADVLVTFDNGSQCWIASHELQFETGGDLPSRAAVRAEANSVALTQLEKIRAGLIDKWHEPWPGCGFAKVIVGRAINGAIADVQRRKT